MNKKHVHVITHPYLGQYSNSFVMESEHFSIFIDSGLDGNANLLNSYLKKENLVLFATHGHWDHIGLHAHLKENNAIIYAHDGDKQYFEDFQWHWHVLFGQYANDFDLPEARWTTFQNCIGKPISIDQIVSDGDIYCFDDLKFEVIHTPGHSYGSICLYEHTNKVLFTGDSLMGKGFFAGIPQYTNPDAYIQSMEKLKKISPDVVYSCHNEPLDGHLLRIKAQESIDTVNDIEQLVETYLQANSDRPDFTLKNLVAYVCQQREKSIGGGACVTVMSHLRKLRTKYPVINHIIETHEEE